MTPGIRAGLVSRGRIAAAAGILTLQDSTAGFPDRHQHCCQLSPGYGSAFEPTSCEAHQRFYYHRYVMAQINGPKINVLLDAEPILPGEEECAAALRFQSTRLLKVSRRTCQVEHQPEPASGRGTPAADGARSGATSSRTGGKPASAGESRRNRKNTRVTGRRKRRGLLPDPPTRPPQRFPTSGHTPQGCGRHAGLISAGGSCDGMRPSPLRCPGLCRCPDRSARP